MVATDVPQIPRVLRQAGKITAWECFMKENQLLELVLSSSLILEFRNPRENSVRDSACNVLILLFR